jgi:hypothetical protein
VRRRFHHEPVHRPAGVSWPRRLGRGSQNRRADRIGAFGGRRAVGVEVGAGAAQSGLNDLFVLNGINQLLMKHALFLSPLFQFQSGSASQPIGNPVCPPVIPGAAGKV